VATLHVFLAPLRSCSHPEIAYGLCFLVCLLNVLFDIESIDALCTAIQNFNGGVVVVTHDARLVEACDCRLWVVDDGGCWAFNGEFEDYKAQLLNDLEHKIQAEEERRAAQQAQRRLKAGGGSSRKAA